MKQTKKIVLISSIILFIGLIIFTLSSNKNKNIIMSKHTEINLSRDLLSLMLETGVSTGEYVLSDKNDWPTGGYTFNASLSKCENGSALEYNEATGEVILKANISDKCYVYFDAPLPDLYITPTYNGTIAVPNVVGATAQLSCADSTSTYNQKYNRIEVSAINAKNTNCKLTYTNRTSKTYLNNKIISLAGTTQGDGQVVNEKGYRFEGKNPNNYIWFNNELWRIIGVFDSTSHGQSGQNLVKIIREEPLQGLAWNKLGINDWGGSGLKKILNPISGDSASGAYYNKTNGTDTAFCYGGVGVGTNCDYRKKGISAAYRPMIKNVTWHLGGHSTNNATTETFYNAERGTTGGNGNPTLTSDTGYIGLMYASDYGYSVLASSCTRTTNLGAYNTATCGGQSWLYGKGNEWAITPDSSYAGQAFNINLNGSLYSSSVGSGISGRPVLYLDALVYYIEGDGSISNPYIIGM